MEVATNTQGRHQQDGMWVISTLTATSGVVAGLKTTFAWQNGGVYEASDPAGSGSGGGGGGGTPTGLFAVSNFFTYDPNIGKTSETRFIRAFSYYVVCLSYYITAPDSSYFGTGINSSKGETQIFVDGISIGDNSFYQGNRNPINQTTSEFYDTVTIELEDLANGTHTVQLKVYDRSGEEDVLSSQSQIITFTIED
jgi:hypothetical protein